MLSSLNSSEAIAFAQGPSLVRRERSPCRWRTQARPFKSSDRLLMQCGPMEVSVDRQGVTASVGRVKNSKG